MAIFTALTRADVAALLDHYSLGTLVDLRGIPAGIENTNYFLDTSTGRFVLTVFERLTAAELPFYLHLMQHLARRWLPVPEPAETRGGALFAMLEGKPAAIVTRLPGHAVLEPLPSHCAAVGRFLAKMHVDGRDFPMVQPNLRGLGWWKDTLPLLEHRLPRDTFQVLAEEVIHQDSFAHDAAFDRLPTGPMHADLFRDNVLFDEATTPAAVAALANRSAGPLQAGPPVHPARVATPPAVVPPVAAAVPAGSLEPVHPARIGGVIDFYFAGCGTLLFDLAVTVNDWCVDLASGAFDVARAGTLLRAYHAVRPLSADEHAAWPTMLRAAALRFWMSRLYDQHLPRPAQILTPHDPARFERMLRLRITDGSPPWI